MNTMKYFLLGENHFSLILDTETDICHLFNDEVHEETDISFSPYCQIFKGSERIGNLTAMDGKTVNQLNWGFQLDGHPVVFCDTDDIFKAEEMAVKFMFEKGIL